MRKSRVFFGLSLAIVVACLCAVWWSVRPCPTEPTDKTIVAWREKAEPGGVAIRYPLDGAVFPPEIAPPTFRWEDNGSEADAWLVAFDFLEGEERMRKTRLEMEWTPSDDEWETVKRQSREKPVEVAILGFNRRSPQQILSGAEITISTSQDEVGAPLFFREVNLPFATAVKDPAAYIRWRFGGVSSKEPPPIVLEKLPVCGNCHSFSADGSTLAMEIDSGNDKGSYAIAPVEEEIALDPSKIITWSDYRREDNQKTFGLLCQASPDGRYVVGTVKDRALAIYRTELAFSQLFFLVKGILAIYDRQTKTFSALPGADDPEYVQTNATWSPDGKAIVFARSRDKAYNPSSLREVESIVVPPKEADAFVKGGRKFMYDLYRIPFNNGKGGEAEPIEGASNNGMSNYFAKFSPDGKWIVFCKAKSFMLLQPDSELHIIPAAGGKARRLRCNMNRMNSWHSWSPNGKWLVFSSKAFSIYTQLFLTHIDDQGRSTPPVVLANFTEENRAANIPEFANMKADAIKKIHERFLDSANYFRAADAFRTQNDHQGAVPLYRKALALDPDHAPTHTHFALSLMALGKLHEAKTHLLRAIELQPDLAPAHCNLGFILRQQNKLQEAENCYREALQNDPNLALAHLHLGTLLLDRGAIDEAKTHLSAAVHLDPHDPYASFNLAGAFRREGKPEQAVVHLGNALDDDSDFFPAIVDLAMIRATSRDKALRDGAKAVELATRACELTSFQHPGGLCALAAAYAEEGRFPQAVSMAERAIRAARAGGDERLADSIRQPLELYKQHKPLRLDTE